VVWSCYFGKQWSWSWSEEFGLVYITAENAQGKDGLTSPDIYNSQGLLLKDAFCTAEDNESGNQH